ncbi:hypothetical protein C8R46DRAFT_1189247 [Mycena filopes]|nr:hypothetical protein C8R46DRAFT_1189247 [Mycena filopes]
MTLLSFSLVLVLCHGVHSMPQLSPTSEEATPDDGPQGNMQTDSQLASTTLSRRGGSFNRSITTSIIVGVIGAVAMTAALILGLLLILQKRRKRRKIRDLARSGANNVMQFPSTDNPLPTPDTFTSPAKERPYAYQHLPPPSPEARRPTNLESAWFLDDEERRRSAQTLASMTPVGEEPLPSREISSPGIAQNAPIPPLNPTLVPLRSKSLSGIPKTRTQTVPPPLPVPQSPPDPRPLPSVTPVGREVSGPKNIAQNPPIPPPNPTPIPSRSKSLPSNPKMRTQTVPPPLPAPQSPPDPPPTLPFRPAALPASAVVSPRPRGSSLRGSRPNPTPTPIRPVPLAAGPGRHITSISEDIRPGSRFSISPVARSFPYTYTSRLVLSRAPSSTGSTRHTRLPGIGSLSSLAHLKSDAMDQP